MSHGDANPVVTCTGKVSPSQEGKWDSKMCITALHMLQCSLPEAAEAFCLIGREKSGSKS